MEAQITEAAARWRASIESAALLEELDQLESQAENGDSAGLTDAFFQALSFGTAGLRGIIGVGTNRMNIHTVAQATQGLADYLNAHIENPSVAIARDSRHMGDEFTRVAACVLAANGVQALLYPRVEPVPALSFAVRDLGASAGICMTASHNPAAYNGYKVYGSDGCQITSDAAAQIQEAINRTDIFDGPRSMDFDEALEAGMIRWIGEDTLDRYVDAVLSSSVPGAITAESAADFKLVYTPLNGSGLELAQRVFKGIGIENVVVVPEQARPDGDFPTCTYPNPEIRAAFERAIALCQSEKPDLLLANDPDADRVGAAVPHNGDYVLLSGNEMGILLIDWLCRMQTAGAPDQAGQPGQAGQQGASQASQSAALGNSVVVSTIVSSVMPDDLARHYGFEMRRVLTGFKYIGDQITALSEAGQDSRFLFGYEESYGYLAGTHVRDKDAIVADMLICEMAAWYAAQGKDLVQAMEELYRQFGYHLNRTLNFEFPGARGAGQMAAIMDRLRQRAAALPKPPAAAGAEGAQDAATAAAPAPGAAPAVTDPDFVFATDYKTGAPMPCIPGTGELARADVRRQQQEGVPTLPGANVLEFHTPDGQRVIVRPSGTEPKIKVYLFVKGQTRAGAEELLDTLSGCARALMDEPA